MINQNNSVWFWQRTHTPHMGALAKSLADRGYNVTFVANSLLSIDRSQQGWERPDLGKVDFMLAEKKSEVISLALKAPRETIHLCQGLRGNGLVAEAQQILRKRGIKHWVLMEVIDDFGFVGNIKIIVYHILFYLWQNYLFGVLAIGQRAKPWFAARGMNKNYIYNFAYFLEKPKINNPTSSFNELKNDNTYRFIFVGRLIKLKKVDLLIKAVAALKLSNIEIWVIGSGPEEKNLRKLSNLLLPRKVKWFGVKPITKVPNIISQADCLVLPSRYDGWGAVVSEALMVGTPVICSSACGSASVVKASNFGSVFLVNNINELKNSLKNQVKLGGLNINQRLELIKWAQCLNSESGAKYLDQIINNNRNKHINEPWYEINKN